MIDAYLHALKAGLAQLPASLSDACIDIAHEKLVRKPHGDLARWMASVSALPDVSADLNAAGDIVTLAASNATVDSEQLHDALTGLCPWRKGPFDFFGEFIDTEWRSDWKWQRVLPHLTDLSGRRVLDVGCGSGYHPWRMRAAGASHVVGIDPGMLFLCQFLALKRYCMNESVWFVPARLEQLPHNHAAFDTVFSMGVLYHRRSPLDHLAELHGLLEPGGELVLETLVVEGDNTTVLVPGERYAQMRNVFFIPSSAALSGWLSRAGFADIQIADETVTTTDEQRQTPWMQFHSLNEFLDPADNSKTVEGYLAPRRATLIARRVD